ncbi:hypothetical protein ESB00_01975 [Oleiharenicola lentus]|uniref:DUF6268 domain-containing protein n=1 Tax=Oleiharenicola lentus TaxID=2508720 RepID=A0A4Q1C782_9BACT|nr:DUF6268 family outer membrane beta-barrel protein [Oleiharenicola lentus]RXK54688.1 hypothetical protein ESB00_01975 [Oleiharenicola lentus]
MPSPLRLVLPTLSLGLAAFASAWAQPQPSGAHTATAQFSISADSDLTRGGAPAGEVGVSAFAATWRSSAALTATTRLSYGLNWERFDFDRAAVVVVPDTLQELSVVLGATHRLNTQWMLTGTIRPGVYGDTEGGGGDAFNAPLLLLATWVRSPELAWAFGLRADWFSERAVIPFIGVNWKFAPGWEFSLGMPRAGVSYQAGDALKLTLGASVQGGNYHVAEDPRGPAISSLRVDDTTLDYHEIRVGLAADWKLNESLTLSAEAGVITDQKFDYFDRGITLDGGGIGFFTLGLNGRF